ncbi:hypothetical protein QCD79_33080, partial [Pseudomonas quasicaspiana]|nr:hypothetical protein [Pseudomonas quasicaspiana]
QLTNVTRPRQVFEVFLGFRLEQFRFDRQFLCRAAEEVAVEPKLLKAETEEYLKHLPWPGNVRQLENTCRWITV